MRKNRARMRKINQSIWWVIGVAESLIGLRVLLKMMAANPGNPFANFVYAITDLYLWPFHGLTTNPSSDGLVLEVSSVIGMIVYLLLAWALTELLRVIMGRGHN